MSFKPHRLLLILFSIFLGIQVFVPRSESQGTNYSVLLNGTSSYVDVPYNANLNITTALTLEAWVKTGDTSCQQVIERGDWFQNQMSYQLTVCGAKVRMDIMQNNGSYVAVIGNTSMSLNVWHHIAGVYDGNQMRVYLDGVLDGTATATMAPGNNATGLKIGKSTFLYYPSYFNGRIDEVRISNAAIYSSNFTPSPHLAATSSTKGLWKFDGQTANDSSGSGAHGSLQGSAQYSTDAPTGPNNPPTISLNDPLNNTNFTAGSNVLLDASASDSDGNVTKVEFFQGSTLLGTDFSAPFTFVWSNVGIGSYALSARATDDLGATNTTSPITITVNQGGGDRSVLFNGTSSYVDVPYNANLNITGSLTLEAWVKIGGTSCQQVIERGDWFQNQMSYQLTVCGAKARLDIMQSNGSYVAVIGNTAMSLNVWHHITGVYDGSQMRVYLDGVMDGTATATMAPGNNATGLRIGKSTFLYYPSYFTGRIDEVRVSNTAIYTSNFTPNPHLTPTSSTKGLWKFDGETTNDGSASAANGSLQGGATYSTDVPTSGGAQIPVANANGPYSSQPGQAIAFSNNGSFDPDGSISSYHWNFGDGTSANSSNPSHTYQGSGLFTATLTVTDNAGLRSSATAIVTISGATEARLEPRNQTGGGGENPLSQNFNLSWPLLSLQGRSRMDLGLGLSYNSLVWTKNSNSNYIAFDEDRGFPSPGFRLGFPVIHPLYFNSEVGKYAFLLIGTDGGRTELRQVGTSALYEAADSSHLLLDTTSMTLLSVDGTQLSYVSTGSQYDCTQIKDRNGNFVSIAYTQAGKIDTVTDTLGRIIKFNYVNGLLTSITQVWNQDPLNPHVWAAFTYQDTVIQTNFTGLSVYGPANNSIIKTLAKVTLADGSHTDFTYTSWGQVWKISDFAPNNELLNYRAYKLAGSPLLATGPQNDCPRFTERRVWAKYWNGDTNGDPGSIPSTEDATTSFAAPVDDSWTMPDGTAATGKRAEVTAPDGTMDKIYFIGTTGNSSAWRRGLPALVVTYSAGVWQRKVETTWTQDNTSVFYPLNPRVLETNIYDPSGNRARTRIDYQHHTFANGTSCDLPQDVFEYAADATTILRSTHTLYNMASVYTNRHILGLVSDKSLYEGNVNSGGVLKSKFAFFYDESGSIQGTDAPVQHDNTNYTASFITGRGNLSSVKRYDVTNTSVFTTTSSKYNTAGSIVSSTDAALHTVVISYADSFSDGVNSRNTLAYPTAMMDPDGYTSTSKYNFDFGAVTRSQTPQPNTTQNLPGPEQSWTFDPIGRLQQVNNLVNNAYTRFEYSASGIRIDTYSTIQEGLGEAHAFRVTDGAGRVIATAADHNANTFSGQKVVYDVMGRVVKASNPTETSAVGAPSQWTTVGDDTLAGWIYTEQTYDWKGRPLVTTNPSMTGNSAETTTKTFSYTGCGCAGGEVVTVTDEGTLDAGVTKRRQRLVYSDVLGRTVKTQILNWEGGSPYSTTVNSYNARDQVINSKVYEGDSTADGSCPNGTCQQTTTAYDGYGRVGTRHVPQQDTAASTVWDYNPDDTVQRITDGRGASQTLSYNARRLITGVSYSAPAPIIVPASLSLGYDAAGNRISMTDQIGSASYIYDQLSRMTSESRTFDTVGTYTIAYEYNLAGQLKKITDPTNMAIAYSHDKLGRNTAVTGENTLYGNVSQYASNLSYRAWGALKGMTYGNNYSLAVSFNSRLLPSQYDLKKSPQFNSVSILKTDYQYYADGSVKFADRATFDGFDRAFAYDQVSMLKEAYSSGQARDYVNGTTGGAAGPYRQTYQHNAFGNLTSRNGNYWNESDEFSATYQNNRNQDPLWGFDADGRLKQDGTVQYNYDAAGQNRSIVNPSNNTTITMVRDGDGRQIKRTDAFPGSSVNTYYLRSSVLDGRVIAELSATGQKFRGYVFGGDDLLAVQEFNSVAWIHKDPITGSTAQSIQNGNYNSTAELDPSGVNVGSTNPFLSPPDLSSQWFPMLVADDASCGSNPNCVRCSFEGVNLPCSIMGNLIRSGFAVIDPIATSPSTLRKLESQPIYGTFCVETSGAITGVPAGTPAGGSIGTAAGGGALVSPTERSCTEELVGYSEGNLAMNLIPLQPSKNKQSNNLSDSMKQLVADALKFCIPDLYDIFDFVSFQPTEKGKNGTIRIKDLGFGNEVDIVNDSTPPPEVGKDIKAHDARGRNDSDNPWWTWSIARSNSPDLRPGEKRYPAVYSAPGMDWVRTQIHETGAALFRLRNIYHPGAPWPLKLEADNLDPSHPDQGPALENCVGKYIYHKWNIPPVMSPK